LLLRIWNLVLKELTHLRRDWVLTGFILTLPVLQLVLLAQATSSRIGNLGVSVLDRDRSGASRRLLDSLDNRRELDVSGFPTTMEELRRSLDSEDIILGVVVPEDFAASLNTSGQRPAVQLIADGSNDVLAEIALAAAHEVLDKFGTESYPSLSSTSLIDLRPTVRFNPSFDVKHFTVPAQVGFIVYQVTLVLSSIGLARERELGTLEQLIVMPLRRFEVVVGKAAPALIVGVLNFVLMLAVTVFGFRVPMRGSFWLLLALTVLFIVVEIGYGVLISSLARTQQQAILFTFVLAMVDMAFSGYMVRVENLPLLFRTIAQIVPFRHYLTIIRRVMLKGAGLNALWPHAAVMVGTGVVVTALAVRSLSQRLD
jgi:ABC-2 type transport system permease protein